MRRVVSLYLPTWPTDRWKKRRPAPPPEAARAEASPARPAEAESRGASRFALSKLCECDRPGAGWSRASGPHPLPVPAVAEAVVLAHRIGSRRVVHAACAAARAAGVHPGMTVAQAQLLLPTATIAEPDIAGDLGELRRLARWAARHVSPLAAADPPDGLLMDATGLAHLHGGEAALIDRLTAALAQSGLTAAAAIADTPGAAHAWARFGSGGVLAPGAARAALGPLPVAALRLPEATVRGLEAIGADRIGELAVMARAPLALRFGRQVLERLDAALGDCAEPIRAALPPRVLSARLRLAEPVSTPEALAEVVRRLSADLGARLALGGLGARAVRLGFSVVDGRIERRAVGFARPSRDPDHLERLLLPQIETVDPGFGIEAAVLTALRVEPLGPRQLGPAEDREEALAELADRLANRPETRQLGRAAPLESDMPERSVARLPALAGPEGSWPAWLPRPCRLFSEPEPVSAIAMLPDHPPVRFSWRGRSYRVTRADGPERVHGEWWRVPGEEASVRDYFQVEDEAGRRFWLFRSGDGEDAASGDMRWWLHGLFG